MKETKTYKKSYYYLPIFGANINIVFNHKDFKHICKYYHNYKIDDLSPRGETLLGENQGIVIGIFNNDLSTVVHEITHAAIFILDNKGINPVDSIGEVMAYLQAELFEVVSSRMKDIKGK